MDHAQVSTAQHFIALLQDCIRGTYRDRIIVCNPDLRLYTRALGVFAELQERIFSTMPDFRNPSFAEGVAAEMDTLRGRELPGFVSAQSFRCRETPAGNRN